MGLVNEIRYRLWEKQEVNLTPRLLVWFLDKWMHDISINCRTHFYNLSGLKQHPFTVSVDKESGFQLAGSFAQGLTTWKLRNHTGQQYHLRLEDPFSAHSVLAEFSFLWLSNQDAPFLTAGQVPFSILEANLESLSCGSLCSMVFWPFKASRRILLLLFLISFNSLSNWIRTTQDIIPFD